MNSRLKVNLSQLLMIIVFAIAFELPIVPRISELLYRGIFVVQIAIMIYCVTYMVLKKQFVFEKYEYFLIAYLIWGFVVIVLITSTGTYNFFRSFAYPIVSVVVMCKWIFRGNYKKTIRYISVYYAVVIWINMILMIVFPRGLIYSSYGSIGDRANWLFGSKNNVVYILPFLLLLFGLDSKLNSITGISKILRYFTMGALFLSFSSMGGERFEFLSGSTTGIFMMLIYFILVLILDNKRVQKSKIYSIISIKSISIFSFILMFLLTAIGQGRFLSTNSIFLKILGLTGKGIGFSGRNSVWNAALLSFSKSPIMGIGLKQQIFITYNNASSTNTSLYSFWFNILIRYGIVGTSIVFLAFSSTGKKKERSFLSNQAYVCFFLMMIGGLTYPLDFRYVLLLTTIYCLVERSQIRIEKRMPHGKKRGIGKRPQIPN